MSNLLYLVRHGENVANLTKEFSYKKVDYSLTARGRLQARQTADLFAGKKVDAIYSSPLKRAIETAEIISRKVGIPLNVVEAFREINIGSLEDSPPSAESWGHHNRIVSQWIAGNKKNRFPEGEDYHSLWRRFQTGLRQALEDRAEQSVIIVGHGGMFSFTMLDFCPQTPPAVLYSVEMHNCAVSTIQARQTNCGYRGRLLKWADTGHLSGEAARLVSSLPEGGISALISAEPDG